MITRCFIAIHISEPIKKQIADLIVSLKKYDADIKWVKPDGMHITLKFLGNTQDSMIPKINDALVYAALSFDPFSIILYRSPYLLFCLIFPSASPFSFSIEIIYSIIQLLPYKAYFIPINSPEPPVGNGNLLNQHFL